ncbi:PKD domain-containing protein [bacterium]|nr:PKD domain-containing protein [bacterium]
MKTLNVFLVIIMTMVLLVSNVNVWAQTSHILNVPFFSQVDTLWSGYILGPGPYTIGSDGCTMTSATMTIAAFGFDINPSTYNIWLQNNNGYTSQSGFIWSKIAEYTSNIVKDAGSGDTIKEELDRRYPVIAKTDHYPNTDHWFLIIGYQTNAQGVVTDYYINDPLNDSGVTISNYNLTGYHYLIAPVPGGYSDGWRDDGTSQIFLSKYNYMIDQGHNLGDPHDNQDENGNGGSKFVHDLNGMWIQDFFNLDNGYYHPHTAIIYYDDYWYTRQAHILKEGFWDYYMNHQGWETLGIPVEDEYPHGNTIRQTFWRLGGNYINDPNDWEKRYLEYDSNAPPDNNVYALDQNAQPMYIASATFEMNDRSLIDRSSGIYHSGFFVADFGQAVELIDQQEYDDFYAVVNQSTFPIDNFFMDGNMTVYVQENPDRPIADFSATPVVGEFPLVVQFYNQSNGSGYSYSSSWDFGDGGTSALDNPDHIYNTSGIYTTSLSVSNNYGSNTKIRNNHIIVLEQLVADFTADVVSGLPPLTVQFTEQSVGSFYPHSRFWDFGDGGNSTEVNPEHAYLEPGVYTVSLTISHVYGEDVEVKEGYITVILESPQSLNITYLNETGEIFLEWSEVLAANYYHVYGSPDGVNYSLLMLPDTCSCIIDAVLLEDSDKWFFYVTAVR